MNEKEILHNIIKGGSMGCRFILTGRFMGSGKEDPKKEGK